jgi:hypothetical protein
VELTKELEALSQLVEQQRDDIASKCNEIKRLKEQYNTERSDWIRNREVKQHSVDNGIER